MAHYHFQPRVYHPTYHTHGPALMLLPGDRVTTILLDAHGYDAAGEKLIDCKNPLTGPFVLADAKPGDLLAVTVERLLPNRERGWASQSIHPNLFDYTHSAYGKDYVEWALDLHSHIARPLGRPAPLDRVELPFAPVLGCIGVAPGVEGGARSVDCGPYGGNMDLCMIAPGATVYLPVFVDGGYLFVGDGHATQGDGEITGNGIEVSCEVEFTVRLLPGSGGGGLRAENATRLAVISNALPVEQALRAATIGLAGWLEEEHGFPPGAAGLLLGQVVRYEIGNLVSNNFTAAASVDKSFLPVKPTS